MRPAHEKSVSHATARNALTDTSYSCGLQVLLMWHGALRGTNEDIIEAAKIKRKFVFVHGESISRATATT